MPKREPGRKHDWKSVILKVATTVSCKSRIPTGKFDLFGHVDAPGGAKKVK